MNENDQTLWVTDAELIRRLGVPEKIMRANLRAFDRDRGSGFPQKRALYGNRRFWPAVLAYYEATEGLKMAAPQRRSA